MPSPPSPLSIRHDAHEQREMQPQIRERFTDASSEAGAAYRRGAGSGNERGEKPGARLRCGSEDADSPVEKGTEHQEPVSGWRWRNLCAGLLALHHGQTSALGLTM